jgi:hypothetical protein
MRTVVCEAGRGGSICGIGSARLILIRCSLERGLAFWLRGAVKERANGRRKRRIVQ